MDVESNTSADGRRTVVNLHDDRGEPYRFISDKFSILGASQYNDVLQIPLTSDPGVPGQTPPRPNLVRGQIFIGAQIAFDPAGQQYVLADVIVTGFVGSTGTVIKRGQLGGAAPLMRVTFEDSDTFDKIVVTARAIVNGSPSATTSFINSIDVTAVAYMWS